MSQSEQIQNQINHNNQDLSRSASINPITQQIINSRIALNKTNKKKTKKLIAGKKLKILLEKLRSMNNDEAHAKLSPSLKTLYIFHKYVKTSEVIEFLEYIKSHEIVFKNQKFPNKFKALFKTLGGFEDLQIQIGSSNYINTSHNFPLKEALQKIYAQ